MPITKSVTIDETKLNTCIQQAKDEIRADIENGTVWKSPENFSDLHDCVDANEYGGLTVDGFADTFGSTTEWWGFCYEVQSAVDAWIKNGMVA
jgi:hypothetical protein